MRIELKLKIEFLIRSKVPNLTHVFIADIDSSVLVDLTFQAAIDRMAFTVVDTRVHLQAERIQVVQLKVIQEL